jgi:2-keto-4-pentenoate hydratase
VTAAAALASVEGALPALELPDLLFSGTPRAVDFAADGVHANAIVLGRTLTQIAGLDLALEGVVYEQSGKIVATSTAAEVMGDPLHSLAWLANHLATRGLALEAGDMVMSGSISKLLRPKAGDTIRGRFTRLGSVSVTFV